MEPITPERASVNDVTQSATWNITRTVEQLKSFIAAREDALDVEDFDFA